MLVARQRSGGPASPRAHPADSGFDALRDCGARQVCYLRFVSLRLRAGSGNLRKREKLNSPPITRFPEFSRRAEISISPLPLMDEYSLKVCTTSMAPVAVL